MDGRTMVVDGGGQQQERPRAESADHAARRVGRLHSLAFKFTISLSAALNKRCHT